MHRKTNFHKDLKSFIELFAGCIPTDTDKLLKLYDETFYIEFDGHIIELPFDAVTYNALLEAFQKVAAEQ